MCPVVQEMGFIVQQLCFLFPVGCGIKKVFGSERVGGLNSVGDRHKTTDSHDVTYLTAVSLNLSHVTSVSICLFMCISLSFFFLL